MIASFSSATAVRSGLLVLVALALGSSPVGSGEPAGERVPIDSGLTERTGVRRLFIDVEAVDADGDPMPGLRREDFRLRLDYVWRKIETLDDLCPCAAEAGVAGPRQDPARAAVTAREVETRWVLYFDFGELPQGSRGAAIEEARRWVRDVKRPGDEAMIVVHASGPGLRELSPFTHDPAELLVALDAADRDAEALDPFPSEFGRRLGLCSTGALSCYHTGRKEYYQAERSLHSLLAFLTRMDAVPGRKALLLFHRNLTMFPGRLYAAPGATLGAVARDGKATALVPDLIDLTAEVGAAATVARTEIYPVVLGGQTWTVNFGANVADHTGGDYNRLASEVAGLVASAGRGCKCIYRIGVEPPSAKSKIYRVKVRIKGRSLPSRYRVHHLTRADRLARTAASVLTNPEDAWDLSISTALVPVAVRDGLWRMKVQVALDPDDLDLSTTGEDRRWDWEVGALLARHEPSGTAEVHEMLGLTRMLRSEVEPLLIVHERTFEDLPPGDYELRAYVRDRNGERLGGARERISLPATRSKLPGVAGPTAFGAKRPYRLETLPLRAGPKKIELTREQRVTEDWLPLGHGDPPGDADLRFVSWYCPERVTKKNPIRVAPPTRSLVGPEDPQMEFPAFPADSADCVRAVDTVDRACLPEGAYEFRLDFREGRPATATFEVD